MLDVDLKQKLLFICTADKISYVINISFFKKKKSCLPEVWLCPPVAWPPSDAVTS